VARREKVLPADDAVARFVPANAFVAVGGMHGNNNPMALVRALVRQRRPIRTLLTSPSANINADLLVGAGLVEEIVCSYVGFEHLGLAPAFRAAAEAGRLRVREADEAYVVLGLRAGAAGQPFAPLPPGLEATSLPALNPDDYRLVRDPYSGEEVLCVPALRPDVALVHCQTADAFGNGIFEGSLFTDLDMARAAKATIVQCEELVATDALRARGRPQLPGILVSAVVVAPFGCHPTASHRRYRADEEHLRAYLRAAKEDLGPYLERYVLSTTTPEDYMEAVGRERLEGLRRRTTGNVGAKR
jgi:glutaconate CoA-transferase subunit A